MTEAENREIPRPFPSEPDFDHSPLETGPDRPQYLPTAREWEERDTADEHGRNAVVLHASKDRGGRRWSQILRSSWS